MASMDIDAKKDIETVDAKDESSVVEDNAPQRKRAHVPTDVPDETKAVAAAEASAVVSDDGGDVDAAIVKQLMKQELGSLDEDEAAAVEDDSDVTVEPKKKRRHVSRSTKASDAHPSGDDDDSPIVATAVDTLPSSTTVKLLNHSDEDEATQPLDDAEEETKEKSKQKTKSTTVTATTTSNVVEKKAFRRPPKEQRRRDKMHMKHLKLVKKMQRYIPKRACGRCSSCKKAPCGECKNCAYNKALSPAQLVQGRKRCANLKCDKMGPKYPGEKETAVKVTVEFKQLLSQLNQLDTNRVKWAKQVRDGYDDERRYMFAKCMLHCVEQSMKRIIITFADVLVVDEYMKITLVKHMPYFMKRQPSKKGELPGAVATLVSDSDSCIDDAVL